MLASADGRKLKASRGLRQQDGAIEAADGAALCGINKVDRRLAGEDVHPVRARQVGVCLDDHGQTRIRGSRNRDVEIAVGEDRRERRSQWNHIDTRRRKIIIRIRVGRAGINVG